MIICATTDVKYKNSSSVGGKANVQSKVYVKDFIDCQSICTSTKLKIIIITTTKKW